RQRGRRRRRAARAALSVPGRAGEDAARWLPEPPRGRVGAGGAAEHGRVAGDPAPPRGGEAGRRPAPLRRPAVAGEPERGLPDRASAGAGPDRARRARRLAPSYFFAARRAFMTPLTTFGPCLRARPSACCRCFGGSRRQTSHAATATAHADGRSLNLRAILHILSNPFRA